MLTPTAAPKLDPERGFLPFQDPLKRLPRPFDAWEHFASLLPKLMVSDQLRHLIEELPSFPVDCLKTEPERERAMTLLSYLGHAYVWRGPSPAAILRERLAVPWHAVAETLGRPPVLSYSSYALHNYFRLDPARPIECGNLGLIQNFLGGIDEEWFILIHVEIERKAAPALAALHPALDAAETRDDALLEQQLDIVRGALESMYATLRRMPEWCDPYIYYHRVRPYIHGWKDNPGLPDGVVYSGVRAYRGRPQKFRGETGAQSTIVPSLDATLGIVHSDDALRRYLAEMRLYMPPVHRAFLESLESRPSVRPFVLECRRPSLTDSYNACVDALARFRALHLEYAAAYIFRQAESGVENPHALGTGGTPFMPYLTKHRDETSLRRLG